MRQNANSAPAGRTKRPTTTVAATATLPIFHLNLPTDDQAPALKWDGEWHITYEVFRDLGLAFAAVLVLIYVLNVAWFQSFKTPLVIMSAIPFSLIGILPAHGGMGAFFTATSMIGFIAASFTTTLISGLDMVHHIGASPEKALATAVLYLVPGVPLINCTIDLIEGYIPTSTARGVNGGFVLLCIAVGMSMSILLLGIYNF